MSYSGVYPMLYAFSRPDGRLDEDGIRRQVRGCLSVGAHGIAILGLITEVAKLNEDERRSMIAWTAEEIDGRVPLAVTIAGPDIDAQIASAREAKALGASWLMFQPPGDCRDEASLLRAFGHAADVLDTHFGIQNAPQYLGIGLGLSAIRDLHRNHPNFTVLKGEAPATEIARVIDACGAELSVFNGRGGLELPDILRAGCVGMIPAPECCDVQIRIYEAMQRGDEDAAMVLYREALPLIVFVMQSIEASLTYGKRITATRLGLGDVYDRDPALRPTQFGLACARAHSAFLPPYSSEEAR